MHHRIGAACVVQDDTHAVRLRPTTRDQSTHLPICRSANLNLSDTPCAICVVHACRSRVRLCCRRVFVRSRGQRTPARSSSTYTVLPYLGKPFPKKDFLGQLLICSRSLALNDSRDDLGSNKNRDSVPPRLGRFSQSSTQYLVYWSDRLCGYTATESGRSLIDQGYSLQSKCGEWRTLPDEVNRKSQVWHPGIVPEQA